MTQSSVPLSYAIKRAVELSPYDISVTWHEPHAHDWRDFDYVIIGISPPISRASNRLFPALKIIGEMTEAGKENQLAYMVDTPNTGSVAASLQAAHNRPSRLFTMYSHSFIDREEVNAKDATYRQAVMYGLEALASFKWPTTYVPALPWATPYDSRWDFFPQDELGGRVVPVYPEILTDLLEVADPVYAPLRDVERGWAAPISWGVGWSNQQDVRWPISFYKLGNLQTLRHITRLVSENTGSLMPPNDSGWLWWSSHWVASFAAGVPIATSWRETQKLGPEWRLLPAEIEEMTTVERWDTSVAQGQSFFAAMPGRTNHVSDILRSMIYQTV